MYSKIKTRKLHYVSKTNGKYYVKIITSFNMGKVNKKEKTKETIIILSSPKEKDKETFIKVIVSNNEIIDNGKFKELSDEILNIAHKNKFNSIRNLLSAECKDKEYVIGTKMFEISEELNSDIDVLDLFHIEPKENELVYSCNNYNSSADKNKHCILIYNTNRTDDNLVSDLRIISNHLMVNSPIQSVEVFEKLPLNLNGEKREVEEETKTIEAFLKEAKIELINFNWM